MLGMKLIIFLSIVLATIEFDPAKFTLTTAGNRFQPPDVVDFLSTFINVRSIIQCATLCYRNSLCRTFDFDSNSTECRLFEGSIDTGSLLSNFSSTMVGSIDMNPSLFSLYNASNNQCVDNRFLNSNTLSGRCECPVHTFWNGSMCLSQRFNGETCVNTNWCRTDLWLNCILSMCVAPPTPPCTPQATAGGTLFTVTNPSSFNYPTYTSYAYTWVATGSSATLSFFFRHDPGGWMLDDVNVYHGLTQMITNGGFESGNLNGWSYSGSCFLHTGEAYYDSSYAHSGNYYYYDRCRDYGDTISQTFSTIAGDTYVISFWLTNYDCCTTTEIATVTIT